MSDAVVIRQLPPDALARLTAKAQLAGKSREGYLRDLLVHTAQAVAVDFRRQWQRDVAPDGYDTFVNGFLAGAWLARRNGIPDADLLAALAIDGPEAPVNTAAAPTPAAAPVAANGRPAAAPTVAVPHGVEIVSREYTIGG